MNAILCNSCTQESTFPSMAKTYCKANMGRHPYAYECVNYEKKDDGKALPVVVVPFVAKSTPQPTSGRVMNSAKVSECVRYWKLP